VPLLPTAAPGSAQKPKKIIDITIWEQVRSSRHADRGNTPKPRSSLCLCYQQQHQAQHKSTKQSLILLFENKYAALGMQTETTHPNHDPHCAFATNSSTRLSTKAKKIIDITIWEQVRNSRHANRNNTPKPRSSLCLCYQKQHQDQHKSQKNHWYYYLRTSTQL